MTEFQIHTPETASAEGADVLAQAKAKYGFTPNLIGGMSESPALAEAYLAMDGFVKKTSFTPTERHVVWFAINAEHGCDYCMAAHTGIAKSEKIAEDVIDAARAAAPQADAKLEALRQFTLAMVRERGWVSPEAIEAFLAAGYEKRHVLEVILVISHKVMSNYTNHVVGTPVDGVFQGFLWERPKTNAA